MRSARVPLAACNKSAGARRISGPRIVIERMVITVEWDYPKVHLNMHCYWCHVESGLMTLKEHEAAGWQSTS